MSDTLTVTEIAAKYATENGFDGFAGDECGCSIDDMLTCDTACDCRPAYHVPCDKCERYDDKDDCEIGVNEYGCYFTTRTGA